MMLEVMSVLKKKNQPFALFFDSDEIDDVIFFVQRVSDELLKEEKDEIIPMVVSMTWLDVASLSHIKQGFGVLISKHPVIRDYGGWYYFIPDFYCNPSGATFFFAPSSVKEIERTISVVDFEWEDE